MRRWLVASLVGLARTLDRGVTVSTFAAAGLLRFDTLGRHMSDNWHHFGATQAEPDVAAGLFSWEKRFYSPFLAAGCRVLLVGCGSGRDLIPLLEQGCRAEGLEAAAACADMARARVAAHGLAAPVYTADIATATLTGYYDVVIFSWLCYSYIPQRARRVGVLRTVGEHLAPEGRVLISYVLAHPAPRRALWRLARLAAQLSRTDWRPEYGDVFIARPDTGCIHFEHQFAPTEIEAEGRAAGLAVALHEQASDGYIALRVAPAAGQTS